MTDWIVAISSSITAITILLIWVKYRADHERSRRENAVNLCTNYIASLNRRTASAFRFAETLNPKDSRHLYKMETFSVDAKFKALIIGASSGVLNEEDLLSSKGELKLNEELVAAIRWELITHLNSIEAVLSAWRHNVADKEMIKEQFSHLISVDDGYSIVENFRNAGGGSRAYPSIYEFVEEIVEQNKPQPSKKSKIA